MTLTSQVVQWSRIHLPMQETEEAPIWSLGREDLRRRKWQPTLLLPGNSHGQRSRAGYSHWGYQRVGQKQCPICDLNHLFTGPSSLRTPTFLGVCLCLVSDVVWSSSFRMATLLFEYVFLSCFGLVAFLLLRKDAIPFLPGVYLCSTSDLNR